MSSFSVGVFFLTSHTQSAHIDSHHIPIWIQISRISLTQELRDQISDFQIIQTVRLGHVFFSDYGRIDGFPIQLTANNLGRRNFISIL